MRARAGTSRVGWIANTLDGWVIVGGEMGNQGCRSRLRGTCERNGIRRWKTGAQGGDTPPRK